MENGPHDGGAGVVAGVKRVEGLDRRRARSGPWVAGKLLCQPGPYRRFGRLGFSTPG